MYHSMRQLKEYDVQAMPKYLDRIENKYTLKNSFSKFRIKKKDKLNLKKNSKI